MGKKFIGYKQTGEGVLTIVEDGKEIIAGSATNCGLIPKHKKDIKKYTSRQKCLEALIREIENSQP